MKKFLSLFLVLAMLAASLTLFASCDDSISLDDVQEDPYTTLMKAYRNTMLNFFFDDDEAKDILKDASTKGSFALNITEGDVFHNGSYSSTFFADAENGIYSTSTTVKDDDDTEKSVMYMTPDYLIFDSEEIYDKPIKISTKNLSKDFKNSNIAKVMKSEGASDDDISEIVDVLAELEKQLAKSYAESTDDADEYFTIFMEEIAEAEITIDNETYDCVKVPFELTKKNAEELINKIFEKFDLPEEEDAKEEAEDAIEYLFSYDKTALSMTAYIDTDTNSFVQVDIDAEFSFFASFDENGNKTPDVNTIEGTIKFGATRMILEGSYKAGGATYSLNGEIVKTVKDSVTNFAYSLSMGFDYPNGENGSTKLISGNVAYNAETGKVDLKATIYGEGDFTLDATFKVVDGAVKFTFDEFTSVEEGEDDVLKLNVTLIINAEAEAPAEPSGAVDLFKLSEKELDELLEEFGYGMSYEEEIYDDLYNEVYDEDIYDDLYDEDFDYVYEDVYEDIYDNEMDIYYSTETGVIIKTYN